MIQTSGGLDVARFLDRVGTSPSRYEAIVVCCPYIGAELASRLVDLLVDGRRDQRSIRVVTSPEGAELLLGRLPGAASTWNCDVVAVPRLHAKIYLAIGRRRHDSEAIVTSANLTHAGVARNIEFGVRAIGSSEEGRSLLYRIHDFVRRLAA